MRSRFPVGLAIMAGLAVGLTAGGQQRFRVGVDVLHIQVSVADEDGTFVPGLDADDFVLRVDGEVRPIVTAYPIDSDDPHESWLTGLAERGGTGGVTPDAAGVSELDTLPGAARRRFVLYIDLSRMSRSGLRNIRRAGGEFLDRHVRPADLLAVVTYSSRRGLEYLVPFTTRHELVGEALGGMGSSRATEAIDDVGEGVPLDDLVAFYSQEDGDSLVADFVSEIEETRFESAAEQAINALEDLADSLRSTEGRKYVLMFAHNLPNGLLENPGVLNTLDEFAATARRSDVVFHTFEPSNVPTTGLADPSQMRPTARGFRGDFEAPPTFVMRSRMVLHFLARETGGEASFWRWAVRKGLEEVERVTNDYYLLAFPLRASDGETIGIEVEVVSPEIEVTWAPTELAVGGEPEVPTEFQRHFDVSEALEMGARRNDLDAAVQAWVLPPADGQRARVAVAAQIGPDVLAALRDGNRDGLAEFELLGLTVTSGRNVLDYFRASARADFSGVTDPAALAPFRFSSWLRVPAGRHYVKVLMRESVSGRIFSRSLTVSVPDEPEQELRLDPPLVVLPPGGAQVLRGMPSSEILAAEQREARDPFEINGILVVPELSGIASVGDPLAVLLTAHGVRAHPDSGEPRLSLSAFLSDGAGGYVPLRGLTVIRSEWDADTGLLRVITRVPIPADVERGLHILRLVAADGIAGDDATTELQLMLPPSETAGRGGASQPDSRSAIEGSVSAPRRAGR